MESLFDRYRTGADVGGLARVFDVVAPELLALARHLAQDEAAAEDLVHATFVSAIENASRFDSERPLVAWLVGILNNKAKVALAFRLRRPDVSELDQREVEDPSVQAEIAEIRDGIEKAVAKLPEKYRIVVQRHLMGGLAPEVIAKELSREPGTVRVQLHRGLLQVRKLLPASFALGALATLAPRGLSEVRADTLRAAAHGLGSRGATQSRSAFRRWPTKLVAGVGLLLLGVALRLDLGRWPWSTPASSASESRIARRTDSSGSARESGSPESPLSTRPSSRASNSAMSEPGDIGRSSRASASGARATGIDPASLGELQVEVQWHDGSPAAGVNLKVCPIKAADRGAQIRYARSDASGSALFSEVIEGEAYVLCDRGDLLRCAITAQTRTKATIRLEAGCDVQVQVMSDDGKPVPGASVWAVTLDQERWGPWAITDSAGCVVLRSITVRNLRGASEFYGAKAEVGWGAVATRGSDPFVIVLHDRTMALQGVVRRPDGGEARGAIVWVTFSKPTAVGSAWSTTITDDAGRFEFDAVPTTPLAIHAVLGDSCIASVDVFPDREPRADLVLQTTVGATLSGRVTDTQGNPMPGVSVFRSDRDAAKQSIRPLRTTTREDGSYTLVGLERAPCTLVAQCHPGEGFFQNFEETIDLRSGAGEWNPMLDTKADERFAISGVVLNDQGEPEEGITVRAVTALGSHGILQRSAETTATGEFVLNGLTSVPWRLSVRPNGGTEIPDGLSAVQWRLALRRGGETAIPAGEAVLPPKGGVRFVVPKARWIGGRLIDDAGAPLTEARFVFWAFDRENTSSQAIGVECSLTDGVFRVPLRKPGKFRLDIEHEGAIVQHCVIDDAQPGTECGLGTITVPRSGFVVIEHHGLCCKPEGVMILMHDGVKDAYAGTQSGGREHGRIGPVPPGVYKMQAYARNAAAREVEVHVVAEQTTKAVVSWELGRGVVIEVAWPEDVVKPAQYEVEVVDSSGRVRFRSSRPFRYPDEVPEARGQSNRRHYETSLPYGSYEVRAADDLGRSARQHLEVRAPSPDAPEAAQEDSYLSVNLDLH